MIKILDWYMHRKLMIARKYGGWGVEGDFNLYKTLSDAKNAIDKAHDGSHKAEPRIVRTMTDEEFINLFG